MAERRALAGRNFHRDPTVGKQPTPIMIARLLIGMRAGAFQDARLRLCRADVTGRSSAQHAG